MPSDIARHLMLLLTKIVTSNLLQNHEEREKDQESVIERMRISIDRFHVDGIEFFSKMC